MKSRIFFIVAVWSMIVAARAIAGGLPPDAAQFIEQHCLECHDDTTKKGDLDLTALPFDPNSSKTFDMWVKVHDRVRDGEMPPKKQQSRLDAAAVKGFLTSIAAPMVVADKAREGAEGRSVWRRLNRYEYENALRDLLHAPWLEIKEMLPEDGESHRFNKAGEALDVSHVQMSSYLGAADYALRAVMASQVQRPETTIKRYYARDQRTFAGKLKFTSFNKSPERAVFPLLGTQGQPEVLNGKAPITVGPSNPAQRELEAFGVVASAYEPIEPRFDHFEAPMSGEYRLRFCGYTFTAGAGPEKKWWTADRENIFPGRRSEPITIYSDIVPARLRRLGTFDFTPEPSVQSIDTFLIEGETIRPDPARLFRSRPPAWHNPLAERDGIPGVAYRWLEVEGPIIDQWPPAGHKLMFGDLPLRKTSGGDTLQVVSNDPHADAERLVRQFMQVVYRRPVPKTEIPRFLKVIDAALASKSEFADAMIAGYSAVLCSPGFVCLEEKAGRLDEYALATRLGCFLWNSTPDDELRSLAARGMLHRKDVIKAQTQRMLQDRRSSRFVEAFLDYWLDLRKIVATAPDAVLYPDYYLDDLLTESAELETQRFFTELLQHDLPARNIVSSDFAMLNERLALHYGLPPVQGVAIRRVQLPPDSVRGGLMTQASVLKVTANGTTTSPVLRGAWIMERVLGKPPPPPPASVPAIEPDTRGATTIRAQLDKHRSIESCANCHAKIDPAGFALESFDVMGGWRDHYRATGNGQPRIGFGHNGQPFAFHDGQPVDSSGKLPDGRSFQDVRELKQLLLQDERSIARNLVQQLVVFATGSPARFGDRPQIEKILDRTAPGHFGVRSLIEAVVQSELFQEK